MAIHVVTTKPTEVQAAVWDPTDPVQRALVLAWIQDVLGEDEVDFHIHQDGSLHLYAFEQDIVAESGEALVFDPITEGLYPYGEEAFTQAFDYSHVLVDVDQTVILPRLVSGILFEFVGV